MKKLLLILTAISIISINAGDKQEQKQVNLVPLSTLQRAPLNTGTQVNRNLTTPSDAQKQHDSRKQEYELQRKFRQLAESEDLCQP